MPTRRTITVVLSPKTEADDYNQLANAIWSVAAMSDHFEGVEYDGKANPDDLNTYYDEDGRNARWS